MAHRYGSFSDAPVTTANMRCQANLKCPQGLTVSGDLVIPPGNVYVNFKIKDDPPQEGAPVGGGAGGTRFCFAPWLARTCLACLIFSFSHDSQVRGLDGVSFYNGRLTVKEVRRRTEGGGGGGGVYGQTGSN